MHSHNFFVVPFSTTRRVLLASLTLFHHCHSQSSSKIDDPPPFPQPSRYPDLHPLNFPPPAVSSRIRPCYARTVCFSPLEPSHSEHFILLDFRFILRPLSATVFSAYSYHIGRTSYNRQHWSIGFAGWHGVNKRSMTKLPKLPSDLNQWMDQ